MGAAQRPPFSVFHPRVGKGSLRRYPWACSAALEGGGYNNSFLWFRKSRFFFCGARSIGKVYPLRPPPLGVPVTSGGGEAKLPLLFYGLGNLGFLSVRSLFSSFLGAQKCVISLASLGVRAPLLSYLNSRARSSASRFPCRSWYRESRIKCR